MSQFHRENPDLIGTDQDPWMVHESYERSLRMVERVCQGCLRSARNLDRRGLCPRCVVVDEQDNA